MQSENRKEDKVETEIEKEVLGGLRGSLVIVETVNNGYRLERRTRTSKEVIFRSLIASDVKSFISGVKYGLALNG